MSTVGDDNTRKTTQKDYGGEEPAYRCRYRFDLPQEADPVLIGLRAVKRFAVDDMFMLVALQVQAYRTTGESKYLDFVASRMVEYLKRLQRDDGLFYHLSNNSIKWGRGIRTIPMIPYSWQAGFPTT